MKDTCKLTKLVERLQCFSLTLGEIKDITVHRHINQFFYMQKKAELMALREQLEETKLRLASLSRLIEEECLSTFSQWRQDIRWLQHHAMKQVMK